MTDEIIGWQVMTHPTLNEQILKFIKAVRKAKEQGRLETDPSARLSGEIQACASCSEFNARRWHVIAEPHAIVGPIEEVPRSMHMARLDPKHHNPPVTMAHCGRRFDIR